MGKSPFYKMFNIKAMNYPKDRIAVVYGEEKYTWKDIRNLINRLAYSLKKTLKVKKGDHVAILFHNRPEFFITNIALQAIGAVPVPVNYRYVASELEFLLNNSDSIGILFEGELLDLVLNAKQNAPNVRFFVGKCAKNQVMPDGIYDYDEILKKGKNKTVNAKVDWEDLAVIIYTGGTTGRPKGVMLTYENMMVNQEATINLLMTFLPSVKDIDYPKYARSKGQEKLLDVLNMFIGQLYANLFSDPEDEKIVVFELPTKEGAVPVPPMTIKIVEGKIKMFRGKAEKYDVLFKGSIIDQIRDLINTLPKAYSTKGKLSMMPGLIYKFLFGGIHMEGDFKNRMAIIKSLSAKPEDENITVMLITPPLFHLAAYALFIMNWLISGSVIVLPEDLSFNAKKILYLMKDNNVTWTFFVPTMWKWLIDYIEKEEPDFRLDSLEVAFSGAALLRAKYKKKILKYFPRTLILDVFGQTEMAPAASVKIDGDESTIRDRSVGKMVPNIEIKIVDDDGNEVPEGTIGEILYRGPNVMKGYYGDDEKTRKTIDDEGWLHSGDLGYLKGGELFTIERKKECINTGGEKVFPLEVEEIIAEHPAVKDVVVIGVPDETWGHVVRAVIIPKKKVTEQEIIEYCKDRMAGYKKPRSIVFAEKFPISPVGKVLRQQIREKWGQPDSTSSINWDELENN
ncbi:MAG: class I adenylate-forming enzyme family protein [Candidatus Helarchaeota archaeon]